MQNRNQQSFINQTNNKQKNQANWTIFNHYPDLYWDTIYIDEKFYVAHPLELDKLKKLQDEIKKQKNKLNMNQNRQEIQNIQNQDRIQKSQLDKYRPLSGISRDCKTEMNQIKQFKARIKAENQLMGQEQKYQMRAQLNKKKNQQKQPQYISTNQKNKVSSINSQKTKNILDQASVNKKQQVIGNKIIQMPDKDSQKINYNKLRQISKKQEKIAVQKQIFNTKLSKDEVKQTQSHPQKNYVSFHPNEGFPKFQMNRTKTGKFVQSQIQNNREKVNLTQSVSNPTKIGNKSFIVNLRKTPSNSKQVRQSLSHSRKDLKSASSTTSKIQLQILNKKIKQMQEKLMQVESKQKQFQEYQKARAQVIHQKAQIKQKQVKQPLKKASRESDQTQLEGQKYQVIFGQKKRYEQQIKPQSKHPKLQSSGRVQYLGVNSNKSSANSNYQKISKQSNVFDLTIYRAKKLNLASQIVEYNSVQDLNKLRKQIQEKNYKQKMDSQISDLKNMIKQLKLEKIKQQAIIQQLQKKQKQQQSINMLLLSKLEQGSPKVYEKKRIPTQKIQRMDSQQKQQKKMELMSPKYNRNKNQLSRFKQSQIKKVESIQLPKTKKQTNLRSLNIEIESQTETKIKRTQNLPSIKKLNKVNIGAKQISNTVPNPQQQNYREFRAKPLNRKGIIARQVIKNQKQQNTQRNIYNSKSHNNKDVNDQSYSPLSTGRKIFQLQFVKQNKKKTQIQEQQPDLTCPHITVKAFSIPELPQTPSIDISQLDLLNLAKNICQIFNIRVESDDHIYMKKYKNCIIFKTPDIKKTIVWHYSGKFYIGGWDQNQQGEGKKHGQGFEFIPEKHYYQGQFLDGKKNGSGIMIYLNGNIYKGQWVKGLKHGLGTYYEEQSGIVYEGEWKQDKKDGKGVLKNSDNQFYDGTLLKSIKHGYGLQLFSNGDYYKGEYKMGRFHGKGRYVWKNGASYDGNFVEGRRQGIGRWKSNKTQYDQYFGQYKNDKKAGKGQYTWSNGTIYEGIFVNDLKHGQGKVQYPDGRQIRGYWQQGKLIQVDQNISQEQTLSYKNQPFTKLQATKYKQTNSKQLQPSRKLTKF